MDLRGHRTRIDSCDDPELSYLSKLSTLRMVLQDTIAIIAASSSWPWPSDWSGLGIHTFYERRQRDLPRICIRPQCRPTVQQKSVDYAVQMSLTPSA
jgi:hypothetical protein